MTPPLAVILAAGVGRRLGELTADRPKAMVEVGGRPMLDRTLAAIGAAGMRRAVVITGHRASVIDDYVASHHGATDHGAVRVESLWNPEFATANNIVSLLCAGDLVGDGFILLNSDIVFDPGILADVAEKPAGCWLAVDLDEPLGAEEMKVELDADGHLRRISKLLDAGNAAGEYIGIARFDAAGTRVVLDAARGLVADGGSGLYYEDAMDRAAAALAMGVVPTRGRAWTEVDDMTDHQRAQRVAAQLDAAQLDAARLDVTQPDAVDG